MASGEFLFSTHMHALRLTNVIIVSIMIMLTAITINQCSEVKAISVMGIVKWASHAIIFI